MDGVVSPRMIRDEPAPTDPLGDERATRTNRWRHRPNTQARVQNGARRHRNWADGKDRATRGKATGGQVEGLTWRDRIKVRVEGGVLDICAAEPQLQGLERTTEVEGEPATRLSSAQI